MSKLIFAAACLFIFCNLCFSTSNSDDFFDGNFSKIPSWTSDNAEFVPIPTSHLSIKKSFSSLGLKPKIVTAYASDKYSLYLLFNELLDPISATAISNYIIDNNVGMASAANLDLQNNSLVHLTFSKPFPENKILTILVNGIRDLHGNVLNNGSETFIFHLIQPYDLIIDEIMADPKPVVSLPDVEWLEIKNVSGYSIDLGGWKLDKAGKNSRQFPPYILKPDSFIIICNTRDAILMTPYGHVIGIARFPVLKKNSDFISLLSPDDKVIHAINYSINWYDDPIKQKGGWSLEMIDTKQPCIGQLNWKSSNDLSGGSPGRINSVNGITEDHRSPHLITIITTDPNHITLVFDKPMDSALAATSQNYIFSDGLTIETDSAIAPFFERVNIKLSTPLDLKKSYTIHCSYLKDCIGNLMDENNSFKFGLPSLSDSFDLIINEILFDPKPGGSDYIEIYNRSDKNIDLKNISVATKNLSNQIDQSYQISSITKMIFPGEFVLITKDTAKVMEQYLTLNEKLFVQIENFKKLPKDTGHIILLNQANQILDEVAYSSNWHFQLITNKEGLSLERTDYNRPSAFDNFHSASSSVGYGTPGYKNSQYNPNNLDPIYIKVSPEIISPDNDGIDDFATIEYQFPTPGYTSSITVYDALGRPVRYLEKNVINGTKGFYKWDGYGENHLTLKIGIYIIVTEVMDSNNGRKLRYKNAIVLARR